MLFRNFFTLGLLLSVLVLPWWLSAIGAIVGFILWPAYLEGVIPFVFFDLVYGVPTIEQLDTPFLLTILALGVLIIVEYAKKHLVVYN